MWPTAISRPSLSTVLSACFLLALFGPVAAAFSYQEFATARDLRRFPPPGKLVDIGGYRLHLECTGPVPAPSTAEQARLPTVVLDAPHGQSSRFWMRVVPLVVVRARVCVYDRAGLGWSDRGSRPRTAEDIAEELHTLLSRSGEPGPFLLAGSAFGGYVARVFASRYPSLCAGVVLVDPMWEERQPQSGIPDLHLKVIEWAGVSGVTRIKAEVTKAGWSRVPPYPPDSWPLVSALTLRSSALRTMRQEYASLEESAAQVRSSRAAFPPVPLLVLTPAPPPGADDVTSGGLTERMALWRAAHDTHAQIAGSTPLGRQVIAEHTGAPVALLRPEVVANLIFQTLA